MKHLSKHDIEALPKLKRLQLINAISGIKPGNLVGTQNTVGQTNLAIISSVIHLGSHPALLGFILRPSHEEPRHTLDNILESKVFTINSIPKEKVRNAHYTSAKFPKEISEFDACQFKTYYVPNFEAPFVAESTVKIGLALKEIIPIPLNQTSMIIGEVQHLLLPSETDLENALDFEAMNGVGIVGLNDYYELKKLAAFPYARPHEF